MNKKTLIGVIAAAAIILLGTVIYALTRPSDTNTTTTTETSETTTPPTPSPSPAPAPVTEPSQGAIITYSDSGFNPSPLTVKAGTTITVTNNSSSDLSFASADHPSHQKQPELNMDKTLKMGESGTVTITKTGTWGYHNHDMAEHFGQIIVTE